MGEGQTASLDAGMRMVGPPDATRSSPPRRRGVPGAEPWLARRARAAWRSTKRSGVTLTTPRPRCGCRRASRPSRGLGLGARRQRCAAERGPRRRSTARLRVPQHWRVFRAVEIPPRGATSRAQRRRRDDPTGAEPRPHGLQLRAAIRRHRPAAVTRQRRPRPQPTHRRCRRPRDRTRLAVGKLTCDSQIDAAIALAMCVDRAEQQPTRVRHPRLD